jgi:hypothetical protein
VPNSSVTIRNFVIAVRRCALEARRQYARNRFNTMAYVRLTDRSTKQQFAVGTYHMPCVFWCAVRSPLAGRTLREGPCVPTREMRSKV